MAEADEGANSSSVTDAVTETRPDTAAVDPNPAATTAAKVKRLLSCKKVCLVSRRCIEQQTLLVCENYDSGNKKS